VEIASDLDGQGAVVKSLGQLAVRDLAAANKDDGPHQPGGGAEDGQRSAGVAGAGTGGPARPDHARVSERGRHAVVLEAAGRVQAFVLQEKPTRGNTDIPSHAISPL